ncbi:MAG: serine--tRNA ligase [Proteobacteria bacterium]|nr:serine--tRNA ligase [Pseudomonadota bacterium]
MHDLRWIRDNPEEFDRALKRRGLAPTAAGVLTIDARNRAQQTALQEMQQRRNQVSKEIGQARARGEAPAAAMAEMASLREKVQAAEEEQRRLSAEIDEILAGLPNLLAADVPDGTDERANRVVRTVGEPPRFDFAPKEHFDLGEALAGMDFERAAKLAGARFVVLKGALARLHRALAAFMLDLQTREHGYLEVAPPVLVRDAVAFGTGQLPKFGEDLFHTTAGLWLIPTAEVPLTNLVADEIVEEAALPLRFAALTPCFRAEAGAAGKDTRGMLRQHQFDKVELVSITRAEESEAEHERMTSCAEEVLKRLALPYRVMVLSSGDTGFSARKTYDIEVWLPGQGRYREISSCSNCGDFQARRMRARYRPAEGKGTRLVHTLNGSGLAVGRALIAVMENCQRADGAIEIPAALRPYMGGREAISAHV